MSPEYETKIRQQYLRAVVNREANAAKLAAIKAANGCGPCPHRGDQAGEAPCGCGARWKTQPVYTCTIHGECTERATGKAGGRKFQNCSICPDRKDS